MKKIYCINIILILMFLLVNPDNVFAEGKDKDGNKSKLNKIAVDPARSVININNITSWVGADGFHDWVVASSYNGAFPKGTSVGSIFAEGMVWGGQVNDGQTPVIRVDGNTFGTGCKSVFDPARVFRVRPDFQAGSLTDDAASFNDVSVGAVSEGMINELKLQYAKDWLEWPADKGAPYLDADSNGVYEPDPNGNAIYGELGEDIPGIPGASQTLFTLYNDDLSAQLYASPPIGLEIQETYWSYAYTGALGNVIYKKVDLIYKGTAQSSPNSTIDNFYFIQWADPDVGTSTDDFAGCDTALNLGYAYSAGVDATYDGIGLPSAAVGYDYLQGVSQFTGNPNDSAIFNLKWRTGYKYVNSKPMSSFIYFAAGGLWGDPTFDYQGTIQFYNYMKGLLPGGGAFPTEVADVTPFGTYLLAGDPVAGTGKIDGTAAAGAPGDRRTLVVNGPVNLKLGDTAEVVIALVGGIGTDNFNSITVMKNNDKTAQIVFDQLFQLPTLPPPDVNIAELDNKLILDWGSNSVAAANIENFSGQGYNFEGYEVYQLPNTSAGLSEGVKLATFDLVNGITTIIDTVEQSGVLLGVITVTGQDKGIKRFLEVTKDPFRSNQPLRNGQEYYFAVVPYAFNPAPLLPFHALQSSVVPLVGVPQSPLPGVRYSSSSGDTLDTPIHVGSSDGSVTAIVVDPTSTTGQEYKVTFADDGTWSVTNVTTGNVAASNQTNQSGDEAYPIVDGIMVKVLGPQPDFKDFQEVANANGPHDPTLATFLFNGSGFPSSFPPEVDRPTPSPAGVTWGIQSGSNGVDFAYDWFKGRVLRAQNNFGANLIPYDYEIRFTPGKGQMAFTSGSNVDIPFQIWNIGSQTPDDPSDDFQMIPLINDVNADEIYNLDAVDHPISGGDNDPETDWIYWFEPADKTPGTVGYDAWVNSGFNDAQIGNEVMARMVFVGFNAGSVSDPTFPANLGEPLPAPGSVFRIISTKPNTANDVFTFTAPATSFNSDLAKADLDKVNVFPNPYYGFHYRETSRDAKYVTFSHLPGNAIIRIFDLSGVMVRTITKNDPTTDPDQFTTWDLKNNDNYPVASGIYIIHIDMPELGATKILKLAVVQEEQILKVY